MARKNRSPKSLEASPHISASPFKLRKIILGCPPAFRVCNRPRHRARSLSASLNLRVRPQPLPLPSSPTSASLGFHGRGSIGLGCPKCKGRSARSKTGNPVFRPGASRNSGRPRSSGQARGCRLKRLPLPPPLLDFVVGELIGRVCFAVRAGRSLRLGISRS